MVEEHLNNMKSTNKKLKRYSLLNLIIGYIVATMFIVLILINTSPEEVANTAVIETDELFVPIEENITVVQTPDGDRFEGHPIIIDRGFVTDHTIGVDRLDGVIINPVDPHVAVVRGDTTITEVDVPRIDLYDEGYIENNRQRDRLIGVDGRIHGGGTYDSSSNTRIDRDGNHVSRFNRGDDVVVVDDDVDVGLLDRRLAELNNDTNINTTTEERIGLDKDTGLDVGKLTIARDDDDAELGDIDTDIDFGLDSSKGYGVGKGGQLYAYNFPSRGVGAGVGSGAVGAGAGGGAGLGAGIGEGLLNGETVPTLGGVGTYSPPSVPGEEAPPMTGGVGGLVGGAGAGGAAGLVTGMVTDQLGVGTGVGVGSGGGYGAGRGVSCEHLPEDGALHIMMHVDGSGSILNTRKQLDIMKETILKEALLPYYNNDESLYNRRVTIVSSSGERTLRFFTEAAKKDNVLAIAFQDEAQPAYHLPNFNKKPEDHYIDDIRKLKASLNGYSGVYRGVMFQVDRGRTFAKSFKEFVGNAFRGEGYLESNNLGKYYRDNNNHHIKNKDGIVFSDEYHAKDTGTPEYYLDLIFNASKKIGLDLNIYGAGLTDGTKSSSY